MDWKVSFIIPAYNSEKYIASSIKQIKRVQYPNYDIIVVDDGSTDRTSQILDCLSEEKVKVIHQENAGVSAARNRAVQESDADYLFFVDADDRVLPEGIDKLLSEIRFDEDIYMFRYEHEECGKTHTVSLPLAPGHYESESINKLSSRLLDVKYCKNYQSKYFGAKVYQYLVSRAFIDRNDISFPVGIPFAEDCIYCFQLFKYASTMTVLEATCYHYVVYSESASHRYRPNFWEEIKAFYHRIYEINGGDIKSPSQLFFYYYTEVFERAIRFEKTIGKEEVKKIIRTLMEDKEYLSILTEISDNLLNMSEKLLLKSYRSESVKIIYCYFHTRFMARKLKAIIKK